MAHINKYDVNDLVRCSGAFTNSAGTAIDPTTVKFKFKTPDGTITIYTHGTDAQLVKDSTGNYHVDVNANAVGTWSYRFESSGTGQAAKEVTFEVKKTAF